MDSAARTTSGRTCQAGHSQMREGRTSLLSLRKRGLMPKARVIRNRLVDQNAFQAARLLFLTGPSLPQLNMHPCARKTVQQVSCSAYAAACPTECVAMQCQRAQHRSALPNLTPFLVAPDTSPPNWQQDLTPTHSTGFSTPRQTRCGCLALDNFEAHARSMRSSC